MRRFSTAFFFLDQVMTFGSLDAETTKKKKLQLHHLMQVMQEKQVKCITEVNCITLAGELRLHQRRCRSEVTRDADPS